MDLLHVKELELEMKKMIALGCWAPPFFWAEKGSNGLMR